MNLGRLSKPERALWHAFPRGDLIDLRGVRDRARTIRAEVIAALLLGAVPAEPGRTPALRLDGARVTGTLALGHAEVSGPVWLRRCEFDAAIDLTGTRVRDVDLMGSRLAGLTAPLAEISGKLDLTGCECLGQVVLVGAHITGAVQMGDARLVYPDGVALHASRAVIDDDLFAARMVVDGQLRLAGASVGGIVLLDKTVVRAEPGHRAVYAAHLSVGIRMLARGGFTAIGEVALHGVTVRSNADFRGAVFTNPDGHALVVNGAQIGGFLSLDECSAAGEMRMSHMEIGGDLYCSGTRLVNPGSSVIRCHSSQARALVIGGIMTDGAVDFRDSYFAVIRDDPSCWPGQLQLAGLRYDSLEPRLPAARRVEWLRRDTGGYVPENYETLAGMYRRQGDDAAARTVLLARERARRKQLRWYRKPWSLLQEITVGYGYRPLRAGAWLAVFLVLGSVVFGLHRPLPVPGAAHPPFNPFVYTLDLLVPLVNFGLRDAYACRGPEQWLTYLLIAVGWIFATTIAAGIARVLQRQ